MALTGKGRVVGVGAGGGLPGVVVLRWLGWAEARNGLKAPPQSPTKAKVVIVKPQTPLKPLSTRLTP